MPRLTLLNARRRREAGRLQIEEWEDTYKDGWIDAQRLKISEDDQLLVKSMKIAYQAGKGDNHLVPLLILVHLVESMNKLINKGVRREARVSKGNDFVFASTGNSDLNFSGWHALKEFTKLLDLKDEKLINATNQHHQMSTLYAALNIPKSERQLFYIHMGHSESMNKENYQCPLALMGITKTGRHLMDIEGRKKNVDFLHALSLFILGFFGACITGGSPI